MHDWHAENGAIFVEAGHPAPPQYYLKPGEKNSKRAMDTAIEAETLAVRATVGTVDVSTLGKIDLQGPDIAEFLNRLYINGWKTLPVGKARAMGLCCGKTGSSSTTAPPRGWGSITI